MALNVSNLKEVCMLKNINSIIDKYQKSVEIFSVIEILNHISNLNPYPEIQFFIDKNYELG